MSETLEYWLYVYSKDLRVDGKADSPISEKDIGDNVSNWMKSERDGITVYIDRNFLNNFVIKTREAPSYILNNISEVYFERSGMEKLYGFSLR